MRRFYRTIAAAMLMAGVLGGSATAATIYVNKANPAPPGDGSAGNPFVTFTNAMLALAASNAVSMGGHTVLIYSNVYLEAITLTNTHSGTVAAPNIIKGTAGPVVLSGFGIVLAGSSNIVLDGITVSGATGVGINLSHANSDNVVITNCTVALCSSSGITMADGAANNSLRNCLVYACSGDGIFTFQNNGVTTINNCVFYGNKVDGCCMRFANYIIKNSVIACNGKTGVHDFGGGVYKLSYNVFYANGVYNFNESKETADEINALSNCSNNIVANPGFSDVANNWNFNQLYSDSVCFNNGEGGVTIGPYPNPPTVTPSNATYYVAPPPTGDDTHTPAEATNSATAWASLTNAARYAGAGDTVLVNPGVYTGQVNITRGGSRNPVRYLASGAVTLTGNGVYNCGVYVDRATDIRLEGFEITGCATGIYLYLGATNVIRNCSIHNNTKHGVYANFSPRAFLTGLNIYSNNIGVEIAGSAGGTGCGGSTWWGMLDRCRLWAHRANYAIYFSAQVRPQISNCNIYDNKYGFYAWYQGPGPYFENCVIYSNSTYGCQVAWQGGFVRNCIIAGNGTGLSEGYTGHYYVTNSCFYSNSIAHYHNYSPASDLTNVAQINALSGCANNIEVNPQFNDPSSGDFRWVRWGPMLDAGTNTCTNMTGQIDLYGRPRLSGPSVDIGSYEFQYPLRGTIISTF